MINSQLLQNHYRTLINEEIYESNPQLVEDYLTELNSVLKDRKFLSKGDIFSVYMVHYYFSMLMIRGYNGTVMSSVPIKSVIFI